MVRYLSEMATVRGKKVKVADLDFTFFFSNRYSRHGIRVKLCWNRDEIDKFDGFMKLHGNYEYIKDRDGRRVDKKEIQKARDFFIKNKVIFSGIWEGKIPDDTAYEYFVGTSSLKDIVDELKITEDIKSVEELELYVRYHNLFNMND